MQTISVFKVDSPACIWGHVVEETHRCQQLLAQMNVFYHNLLLEPGTLKPSSLSPGQVCVVYWAEEQLWCRAMIQFLIDDAALQRASCLLLDHGERVIVSPDQIRVALQRFLELPFCLKRFRLAGIKPTTLRVKVLEETAILVPSSCWDRSATLYLHNLLQVSTQTEAVLVEQERDWISVQLYLTVDNSQLCVNDDLVEKRFAYYSPGPKPCQDRPNMLSLDRMFRTMLTRPGRPVAPERLAAPGQRSSWGDEEEDKEEDEEEEEEEDSSAALDPNDSQSRFLQSLHCEPPPPPPPAAAAGPTVCETEGPSGVLEDSCSDWPAEPCGTDRDRSCSELLEWLNPAPLTSDLEPGTDPADPLAPSLAVREDGVLVHSSFPVDACSSLDDAPVTDRLRWVLQKKLFAALSDPERYSWPAVARGSNTLIVSPQGQQPLSYLPPLLSHILLGSAATSCFSGPGPIAVLLCVGWKKVEQVCKVLQESLVGPLLHPEAVLLGLDKAEANAVKIPRNCLLLVTTPFSLERLLSCHCFLFTRLCHLVLDHAERLLAAAPDQMARILQHFQKLGSRAELRSCSRQLVAVTPSWGGAVRDLLLRHMPRPCVVIGAPEEAALYAGVQQFVHMVEDSSKLSVLLALLESSPEAGQKTLVVTESLQELEDVFQALRSRSLFCLKTREDRPQQLDSALRQWRTDVSPGTHLVLVASDQCLQQLDIRDALCVVHYGFPSSPGRFGRRLLCMAQHFPSPAQVVAESPAVAARSVLLVTERNSRHANGLLHYLERSGAAVPPELSALAGSVQAARERQKQLRPLCSNLKSFGVCRDSGVCPDRHRVHPQLDRTGLPASGVVEVIPLVVRTASLFLGRMVGPSEEEFQRLSSEMTRHFADEKPGASQLLEGGMYAVEEDKLFYRVKVLCVPEAAGRIFFPVPVCFLDVGKQAEVRSHQILQLPERFHTLPPQAVEIVLCNVRPIDAEADWSPKVNRLIGQKIRGLQHRARVALSLGNTLFVDRMVRVTSLPGLKTSINEHSVESEILKSRMGERNPEHLVLLRALCDHASFGTEEGNVPALIQSDGWSVQPPLPHPAPDLAPLKPRPSEGGARGAGKLDASGLCPSDWLNVCITPRPSGRVPVSAGVPGAAGQTVPHTVSSAETRFHPKVHWYDTAGAVIVTVKLRNPEEQSCRFHPDRVEYSCRWSGRPYRVDLQLHQLIDDGRSHWRMKSNEPILVLVKRQQEPWNRLVRNKNVFVSYDPEHLEDEDEDEDGPALFSSEPGDAEWIQDSDSD